VVVVRVLVFGSGFRRCKVDWLCWVGLPGLLVSSLGGGSVMATVRSVSWCTF